MHYFCVYALAAAVLFQRHASLAAPAATDLQYEYIVVGSGAGGGPLASRLARAGKKTLLIEAGDDQGTGANWNYTVPAFQASVTQDPHVRWDIFVNHYPGRNRAEKDHKYVYDTPGGEYVGLDPPAGAKPKGILYPRAGTLGGCASHNALIWIAPFDSDWENIVNITGDHTWNPTNMRHYFEKVENCEYVPQSVRGHGHRGWLTTSAASIPLVLKDWKVVKHLAAAAATMGQGFGLFSDTLAGLANLLTKDPNSASKDRDSTPGFFQIPLAMKQGARNGPRDYIVQTVDQGFPLTVRTNCFVTKVLFDTSSSTPRATGVEFVDGPYLYRASPKSSGENGIPGSATASKEVILSGGAYNTPQMLKLSGIGPSDELKRHGIPVLVDLPGVGTNLQDRYEISVTADTTSNFPLLNGCTFDAKPHDECYKRWKDNPSIGDMRGVYATDGLAATMITRSNYASNTNLDLFIFGGPVDFTGYFPWWGNAAVADHKHWTWAILKAQTRNRAGTVTLRSRDPLDQPEINFNYFNSGTTADDVDNLDLDAVVEGIHIARTAYSHFADYNLLFPTTSFTEQLPGAHVNTDEGLKKYVQENAWGHHASCTCPIGADRDPMAVLDSKFRVRGVNGLRVVDASVFPRIPGIFIVAPIYMISEKAADTILNGS